MVDANGDTMDGVQSFVKNLVVSYPIGLEDTSTKTYAAITANFKGMNPFPVDVIVGKDGNIVHITREYDPDSLMKVLEAEIAK